MAGRFDASVNASRQSPIFIATGKILGIELVGLVQLVAYAVVGLAAGLGSGLVTITGTAAAVVAGTLGW